MEDDLTLPSLHGGGPRHGRCRAEDESEDDVIRAYQKLVRSAESCVPEAPPAAVVAAPPLAGASASVAMAAPLVGTPLASVAPARESLVQRYLANLRVPTAASPSAAPALREDLVQRMDLATRAVLRGPASEARVAVQGLRQAAEAQRLESRDTGAGGGAGPEERVAEAAQPFVSSVRVQRDSFLAQAQAAFQRYRDALATAATSAMAAAATERGSQEARARGMAERFKEAAEELEQRHAAEQTRIRAQQTRALQTTRSLLLATARILEAGYFPHEAAMLRGLQETVNDAALAAAAVDLVQGIASEAPRLQPVFGAELPFAGTPQGASMARGEALQLESFAARMAAAPPMLRGSLEASAARGMAVLEETRARAAAAYASDAPARREALERAAAEARATLAGEEQLARIEEAAQAVAAAQALEEAADRGLLAAHAELTRRAVAEEETLGLTMQRSLERARAKAERDVGAALAQLQAEVVGPQREFDAAFARAQEGVRRVGDAGAAEAALRTVEDDARRELNTFLAGLGASLADALEAVISEGTS